jgi:SAM-dependent methyltransferase
VTAPSALNSRLKALAERILPNCILVCLDPVQALIISEIKRVADRMQDGQTILDAGAGEARHRAYFKRGRYLALDAGYGDSAWDYSKLDIRGDLAEIPLRNSSVDCVLCMVVLEHTRNPRDVLHEFARILKTGGTLIMVVPFLWEEHQIPHDYFRFTRYGVRCLFESSPFRLDLVNPIGGFFWLSARRAIGFLSFFQGGWRWLLFVALAPFLGFLLPLILYFMDRLDTAKNYSLGFNVHATKMEAADFTDSLKNHL